MTRPVLSSLTSMSRLSVQPRPSRPVLYRWEIVLPKLRRTRAEYRGRGKPGRARRPVSAGRAHRWLSVSQTGGALRGCSQPRRTSRTGPHRRRRRARQTTRQASGSSSGSRFCQIASQASGEMVVAAATRSFCASQSITVSDGLTIDKSKSLTVWFAWEWGCSSGRCLRLPVAES